MNVRKFGGNGWEMVEQTNVFLCFFRSEVSNFSILRVRSGTKKRPMLSSLRKKNDRLKTAEGWGAQGSPKTFWKAPWISLEVEGSLQVVVSKIFGLVATQRFWKIFTPNPGEMIQFDEHIFQRGWNHQLVFDFCLVATCQVCRTWPTFLKSLHGH